MVKNKKSILIIEDEPDILQILKFNLKNEGYKVYESINGEKGLKKAQKKLPDIILLDLMLPGIHGLDVCKILKNNSTTSSIPIIMLTALGQEENIVKGLEAGADDYISKPFSFKILNARIKTVTRRGNNYIKDNEKDIKIFNLKIKIKTREAFINNSIIKLTYTEFQILYLLASHPGWVFTRYQIINKIRGDENQVTDRTIDFQIVGLRKKMAESASLIQTIRGVGYRFKNDEI